MKKIRVNLYSALTNEQLLDFTIEEMDKLKCLSRNEDFDKYEIVSFIVNQLVIEVKRRKLSMDEPLLAKRMFNI